MRILLAKVINPYRSMSPKGFYNKLKGHTGTDMLFNFTEVHSPVTGTVKLCTTQNEMGKCAYIEDSLGNIHVFGHLDSFKVKAGQAIRRNDVIGVSGNTGLRTTNPHLHYEIITKYPINLIDRIMTRKLQSWQGYNTDPIIYLEKLYDKYNLDLAGNITTP